METTPSGQNGQQPNEDLLDDVIDTREYDKKIKDAQNAIFIVAGVQLVFGVAMALLGDELLRNTLLITAVVISVIFFGLGLWSKKMPLTALIVALSLYALLLITDAAYDITTLYKGIIIKAFIIFYLIKGIGAAKAAQDLRKIGR